MKMIRTRHLPLFAVIFLLCAGTLSAQAPLEPAQLPANTAFYFVWRGQPSAEIRKTNSIAALWDDPGFAPVRSSIANALLKNSEEKSSDKKLTREQLDEYASLLDNSFVLGYLSDPHKKDYVVSANPSPAKPTPWNGVFFIYDRTGKEAILTKAVLGLRASEKEVPQISQMTIAGVPTLKVQRGTSVTYWVENGKYAISAGDESVLEEILNRLYGKSDSRFSRRCPGIRGSAVRSRCGPGGVFPARGRFEIAAQPTPAPAAFACARCSTPSSWKLSILFPAVCYSTAQKPACRPQPWVTPHPARSSTFGVQARPRPLRSVLCRLMPSLTATRKSI